MANRSSLPERVYHTTGLPTLKEVLDRRTLPPVDLYSFYIYMRDQQRSVDYLDFWLDVSQHLQLCRHYVRNLPRSAIENTPDLEKETSKRSSYMFNDPGEGPSNEKSGTSDQRLSAFLRSDRSSTNHSPQGSLGSNRSAAGMERPRPSFMTNDGSSPGQTSSSPGQNSSGPDNLPRREDLLASAEKILYTYLLPGSEREIIIPQGLLNDIQHAIEGPDRRDDPDVFNKARDYVFQAMERDAFPGFLASKGLGNIIPPSMMMRLIIGLLALFGGFWAAFVLIFLHKSRSTRCWLILPITVGIYALASHQFMIDPVIALAGYSESTFMKFSKIREPFIKKTLTKRSFSLLFAIILIDAALCCLFILVPGTRL